MMGLWLRTTTPWRCKRRTAAMVLGLSSSRGVEKWATQVMLQAVVVHVVEEGQHLARTAWVSTRSGS